VQKFDILTWICK